MQPVLVKSYSKDTMKFSVEMASGLVKQVVRSSVRFMCEDPEIWKERQTLCKGQAEQAGSIVKFCRDVEEVDADVLEPLPLMLKARFVKQALVHYTIEEGDIWDEEDLCGSVKDLLAQVESLYILAMKLKKNLENISGI